MDAVRARLDSWLGKPQWKQGKGRAAFFYRFESETRPITPLRLKVETNTREHFFVLGPRRVRFEVDSPWHSGAADVLTYELEELLGTKLRALYQRKKGRDLFDLSEAPTRLHDLDPEKVVACFTSYLEHDGRRVTRAEFERNVTKKIEDRLFLSDVPPLLARGISFDPAAALERIRDAFISRIPEGASRKTKGRRRR